MTSKQVMEMVAADVYYNLVHPFDRTLNRCELQLWMRTWEKVRARVEDCVKYDSKELH